MERLKASHAWSVIGLGVLAYELLAKDEQLLSSGVDRALERSPASRMATTAGIGITALHLLNMLPESVDPLHQAHQSRLNLPPVLTIFSSFANIRGINHQTDRPTLRL